MSDATGTATHVLLLQDRAGSWHEQPITGTFTEMRDLADAVRLPPRGSQIYGAKIVELDAPGRTVWQDLACVEGSTETETAGTEGGSES